MIKQCLYCENKVEEDTMHFTSGCCGRGMCDDCYGADVGTMEQIQIDYMENEDYEKYIEGTAADRESWDYVCFEHVDYLKENDKECEGCQLPKKMYLDEHPEKKLCGNRKCKKFKT